MNSAQMGSAACAPVSPWASPLSNPTQTSVTSVGVYPTNHASRPSFVVPVLPATVPGLLSPRTDEAVPASMTPAEAYVMTSLLAGDTTWIASDFSRSKRVPFVSYTAVTADKFWWRTPPFASGR